MGHKRVVFIPLCTSVWTLCRKETKFNVFMKNMKCFFCSDCCCYSRLPYSHLLLLIHLYQWGIFYMSWKVLGILVLWLFCFFINIALILYKVSVGSIFWKQSEPSNCISTAKENKKTQLPRDCGSQEVCSNIFKVKIICTALTAEG